MLSPTTEDLNIKWMLHALCVRVQENIDLENLQHVVLLPMSYVTSRMAQGCPSTSLVPYLSLVATEHRAVRLQNNG